MQSFVPPLNRIEFLPVLSLISPTTRDPDPLLEAATRYSMLGKIVQRHKSAMFVLRRVYSTITNEEAHLPMAFAAMAALQSRTLD